MTEVKDHYLGDGVYVSYDGEGFCLDLRDQAWAVRAGQTMRIFLDPPVLEEFDRFRTNVKKLMEE